MPVAAASGDQPSEPQPPRVMHLLVLPVGDTQGVVLWSTPLLQGAPPQVGRELQQLHAAMAEELLGCQLTGDADSAGQCGPTEGQATTAGCWELAAGTAYQQHLVPLVWDILRCFQAASCNTPAAAQQWEGVVEDVVAFLQASKPPMPATLQWVLATLAIPAPIQPAVFTCNITASSSTNLDSPTLFPAGHPTSNASPQEVIAAGMGTAPAANSMPLCFNPASSTTIASSTPSTSRNVITSVLHGTFRTSSEEQQYQEYLKQRTQALDRVVGCVHLLLLGCAVVKEPLLYATYAALAFAVQLWLQLQLLGRRRQRCNRQQILKWKIWVYIVQTTAYCATRHAAVSRLAEIWAGQGSWVLVCWAGFFGNAVDQVGGRVGGDSDHQSHSISAHDTWFNFSTVAVMSPVSCLAR
jgi:hypothetical protein